MKRTTIEEKMKIELKNPVLVEGLPGLGMVGRIATRFLIRQLNAKKLAELYSPHFPYYVLVNKKGSVRLLRGEFYFWKNEAGENDLMLLTGDSQAQTIEGQYDVASCILDFAQKHGIKMIVTIGGYSSSRKAELKVIGAATSIRLIDQLKKTGVIVDRAGTPIVGVAGLVLALAKSKGLEALCLLGETTGYTPDPGAAKNVLQILARLLRLDIDLLGMSYEMEKVKAIEARIKEAEKAVEESSREWKVAEKFSYIS